MEYLIRGITADIRVKDNLAVVTGNVLKGEGNAKCVECGRGLGF